MKQPNARAPVTLYLGLLIIVACEALLFVDVFAHRRPALHTHAEIEAFKAGHPPADIIQRLGRHVAIDMTPLAWVGYLLFIEGVLARQGDSPLRRRPHHYFLLALASVPIWCFFDAINFYRIHAWRYIGMSLSPAHRIVGCYVSFATIVPGMLMTGQALLNAVPHGQSKIKTQNSKIPPLLLALSFIVGLAMLLWPLAHPDPVTNLTLWTSLVFLVEPVNYLLGRPSLFRDWREGHFARTAALFAGGLACGFLWEFWNYWALAKWTYHLPFLGRFEHYRYFEMPLPGLLGFLPFALECWIVWQLIRTPLDGLAEPLPGHRHLL